MQENITAIFPEKVQTKTKEEAIQNRYPFSQNSGSASNKRIGAKPSLVSSFRGIGLDSIKAKTQLEILEQSGVLFDEKSIKEMKSGIFDLWQCIIFSEKGFTMPWMDKDASLSDCTKSLIESFDKIKHPESSYAIACNEDRAGNEYYFREWREISTPGENGMCMCVGTLERLKTLDIKLHDLLLLCFRYMYQKTGLEFVGYYNSDHHQSMAEWIYSMLDDRMKDKSNTDKDEKHEILTWVKAYQTGIVARYHQSICKNKKVVTKGDLRKAIITSGSWVGEWIADVIDLLETKNYNVHEFDYCSHDPDMNDGRPVLYSDTVGMYWRQDDIVFKEHDSNAEQTAQQLGVYNPVSWRHWYKKHRAGEIISSNWPADFFKLCQQYQTNINKQIIQHYDLDKDKY